MPLDSKKEKQTRKPTKQENERWPSPLLEQLAAFGPKKLATLGPMGSSFSEAIAKLKTLPLDSKEWKELGKLIEQAQKRSPSSFLKALAALGPEKLAELGSVGSPLFKQLAKLKDFGGLGKPEFEQLAKFKNLPALGPLQDYREWERALYDPKTWERMFERIHQKYRPRQASEMARAGGDNLPSNKRRQSQAKPDANEGPKDYLSFDDLAKRWNVSRRTVYRRLRAAGVEVLTFAKRGKRSKKTVSLAVVTSLEQKYSKRLA